MKKYLLAVHLLLYGIAQSQYWPSFVYNGPWVMIKDIPENSLCHQAWEVLGGVSDSELSLWKLDAISGGNNDCGYFEFRGNEILDSLGNRTAMIEWPPDRLNDNGFISFPKPNEFSFIRCEHYDSCRNNRYSISPKMEFLSDGFGFFCAEPESVIGSDKVYKGYVLTVNYVPTWVKQPCVNSSSWDDCDPFTYIDSIINNFPTRLSLSKKYSFFIEGIPGTATSIFSDSTPGPQIIGTNFLGTAEPLRMCASYLSRGDESNSTFLTRPTGGASVRILKNDSVLCSYIYCDAPTNRLVIFSVLETPYGRSPRDVKSFGKQIQPLYISVTGSTPTLIELPPQDYSDIGYLRWPVDVAVTSCGRYFNPDQDFIYVVDQGNHRIIKFSFDATAESLVWVGAFGDNILKMPTSLDYADYGDSNYANDDIFVVDAGKAAVLRFSASGEYEFSFGNWGSDIFSFGYPTAIAISDDQNNTENIFVADSHNHAIRQFIAKANGGFSVHKQTVFERWPWTLLSAIDTDADGNLYVLDSFNNVIVSFSRFGMHSFGIKGHGQGQFDHPIDLYIDGYELQVCEIFGDSTGIQSFAIAKDTSQ